MAPQKTRKTPKKKTKQKSIRVTKKTKPCTLSSMKSTVKKLKKKAPAVKSKTISQATTKRARRSLPWDAANSPAKAKAYYGGTFPTIHGRVYKYPSPSQEKEWMKLVRGAIAWDQQRSAALKELKDPPTCPDKRFVYILFHASPKEVKRRNTRNNHRRQTGLKVGDKRHVHHHNPVTMKLTETVVMTPCEHKRQHGKRCLIKD
jgi:hypothetical protein